MNYILYTDGACSGNPGPGGFGTIVFDGVVVKELGDYFSDTTNNRMELQAVISGLNMIKESSKSSLNEVNNIQIYTDSVYVIKGITQWIFGWMKKGWKNTQGQIVVNKDLWQNLYHLTNIDFKNTNFKWDYVRGHNNDPGNERCDQIAVAFSKKTNIDLINSSAKNYLFDITVPPNTEKLPDNKWEKGTSELKNKAWYISLINGVITRYATWSECESQVKGRPGVKFKKITSEEEEKNILKNWGC